MKKFFRIIVLICLFVIPKTYAKEISNEEFMNEFKVGWNLGNDLDSYYGIWNGQPNLNQETIWRQPKATQEMIDYVLDSGINVIRIPVTWHNHTYKDENGKYHIHKEWLDRVKEVVDYVYNRNAYVIIDTHHDDDYIYLTNDVDDFHNNVIPFVTSIWTEIADYFKDYDEHLLFESYNEIFEITAGMYYTDIGANQMNILNQLFVDIVRNIGSNNTTRLLMIPTLAHGTSQSTFENFKVPIDTTEDKLILSVHFYTNTLDQDIESRFSQMKKYADELNLPLVISEYGTTVSQEKRLEKISNYTARAYKFGFRTIIWDNGSDFMIFNRNNLLLSKHDIIDALNKPHEYNTLNKITLSNYENDWVFARADNFGNINPNILPEWWGTILTKENHSILDNSDYLTLLLKNENNSRGLAIHQIYFYDKDGNYLSSYSSNYPGYISSIFKIPDGASSFKLSIYDAKVNTNKNVFINDFNSGDLALTYGFISDSLYTIGNEIILTSTKDSSDDTNNEESDDTDNTDDESNNNIDNTNNGENDNTDNPVDENNNNVDNTNNEETDNSDNSVDENNKTVDNTNSEESDNIDDTNDKGNNNVDNIKNEESNKIDDTAKVQTDNVLDELSQIEKDGNDNVKIDNKSNNIVPLVILIIAIIAITTSFIIFKIVKKKVL